MKNMDTKRLLHDALTPYSAIATVLGGIIILLWLIIILALSLTSQQRLWVTLAMISICLLISIVFIVRTKRLRKDKRNNDVEFKPIEHSEVYIKKEAVAGSAAVYIPILGRIFPKLWGPPMDLVDITYAIGNDGTHYRIIRDADKGNSLYEVEGRTSKEHLGYVLL